MSLIAEVSCKSLLASVAGDKTASRPTRAKAYAIFILVTIAPELDLRFPARRTPRQPRRATRRKACRIQHALLNDYLMPDTVHKRGAQVTNRCIKHYGAETIT